MGLVVLSKSSTMGLMFCIKKDIFFIILHGDHENEMFTSSFTVSHGFEVVSVIITFHNFNFSYVKKSTF